MQESLNCPRSASLSLTVWLVGSPHHYSIYYDNSINLKAEAACSSKTLVFSYNHTSSQNLLMVSLIMGRLICLKAFTTGQWWAMLCIWLHCNWQIIQFGCAKCCLLFLLSHFINDRQLLRTLIQNYTHEKLFSLLSLKSPQNIAYIQ